MTFASPVLPSARVQHQETVIAKDQPQYRAIPAIIARDGGMITARLKLGWRERFAVFLRGELYYQQLIGGRSVQPLKILLDEPPVEECW